jgi:hypothetical protein
MSNSIHNFLPSYNPFHQTTQGFKSESFQQAAQSQKDSNISITTDEGDVVTISASYAMAMAYAYNNEVTPVSHSESVTAMSMEKSSFSMSIQGDLNDEELQDIKHLLQDLNKIAKAFFQGDSERALNKALDIGDLGSLNQLSASFSYSEQIATTHTVVTYHPLPSGDALADLKGLKEMLTDEFVEDLKFADLLRARWQQLREAFEQEKESIQALNPLEISSNEEKDDDIPASEQMLERVKETIEKQPQLSPYMAPVTKQAIDDAAEEVSQKENKNIQPEKLYNDFLKKWRNWILT